MRRNCRLTHRNVYSPPRLASLIDNYLARVSFRGLPTYERVSEVNTDITVESNPFTFGHPHFVMVAQQLPVSGLCRLLRRACGSPSMMVGTSVVHV